MKRRSYLAGTTVVAAGLTGCLGSAEPSRSQNQGEENTAEEPTSTGDASGNIPESQVYAVDETIPVSEDVEMSHFGWMYKHNIRYYNNNTEELEIENSSRAFFTAEASFYNLSDESIDSPSYKSASVVADGDEILTQCDLPQGITFEQLREENRERQLRQPDCNDELSPDEIGPGDEDRYRFFAMVPDINETANLFFKWAGQYTESEAIYVELSLD